MSTSELLKVGASYDLVTPAEGRVGIIRIEAITTKGTVRSALTLDRHGDEPTDTEATLRRLAEAADQLAFAVMADEEERLRASGLTIRDVSTGRSLVLGTDYQALFVDPEVTQLAFTLRRR